MLPCLVSLLPRAIPPGRESLCWSLRQGNCRVQSAACKMISVSAGEGGRGRRRCDMGPSGKSWIGKTFPAPSQWLYK